VPSEDELPLAPTEEQLLGICAVEEIKEALRLIRAEASRARSCLVSCARAFVDEFYKFVDEFYRRGYGIDTALEVAARRLVLVPLVRWELGRIAFYRERYLRCILLIDLVKAGGVQPAEVRFDEADPVASPEELVGERALDELLVHAARRECGEPCPEPSA